ncbi:Transposon Ty3-I Gag-Pol polyprotein [Araneus ventricosus]|uniref:RNA-directed DNA polymerase n=1 Tax=Araneus ventricosus TaxID=182803 RepID=A0A4Y2DJE9_ARAVE|nr:Transposon Ty3-I Gag-Pol polyprotein [Araneus ventricosus]
MAYRATPLENGFSPSELLMGRRINTTLPVAKTQLQPYSVNKKVLEAKEERRIEGQKTNYDKHHGVRNLDELDPGQNVWITDRRVTGKVLQKTPYPRSYLVQSGRRVYRRNRKHLIPSPDFHPEHETEVDSDVAGYQHPPADADPGCPPLMSSSQSPKTYPERASSSTEASPDPYVTRSDLASGYWHIPLHEKDKEKSAFVTNEGLYEFQVLPFCFRNAPAIFNRIIRRILNKHKCSTFACHYFDDIGIFSNSLEEHYAHLEQIFKICEEEENIKLKFSKCVFAKDKINFLGYEIKEGCITPDNHNLESIKKLQPPKNVKQLQGFLGSVNAYNKFIDSYAKIREPLNQLLKKDKQLHWTAECQKAFELLKNKLVTKPVLQLYDPKLPLHVFCDASQVAIGAILKQPDSSGNLHPVSYHSRTSRSYEKNYCITELKCLAIVDALDKFYYYLHGKKFIIHTDHATLVWLKNVKNLRGRLFCWSLKLSMFYYEVKYLNGKANVEADMLSRHPTAQYIQHSIHLLELDEIKTHQNLDNLDNSKYKKINDVLVLKKKNLFKIVVPFSLRRKVLQNAHEQFGYPGTQKMINLITPQYYWLHINQDISVFVKHCNVCQLNKKKRQKKIWSFTDCATHRSTF